MVRSYMRVPKLERFVDLYCDKGCLSFIFISPSSSTPKPTLFFQNWFGSSEGPDLYQHFSTERAIIVIETDNVIRILDREQSFLFTLFQFW